MSARDERFEEVFGFEEERTPESEGFRLSMEFITQVLLEVERQGIKLKDLAERMGVTQAAVSSMLRGASNMKMATVAKLALALGMDVEAPVLVQRGVAVEYTVAGDEPRGDRTVRYETVSGASEHMAYRSAA